MYTIIHLLIICDVGGRANIITGLNVVGNIYSLYVNNDVVVVDDVGLVDDLFFGLVDDLFFGLVPDLFFGLFDDLFVGLFLDLLVGLVDDLLVDDDRFFEK